MDSPLFHKYWELPIRTGVTYPFAQAWLLSTLDRQFEISCIKVYYVLLWMTSEAEMFRICKIVKGKCVLNLADARKHLIMMSGVGHGLV